MPESPDPYHSAHGAEPLQIMDLEAPASLTMQQGLGSSCARILSSSTLEGDTVLDVDQGAHGTHLGAHQKAHGTHLGGHFKELKAKAHLEAAALEESIPYKVAPAELNSLTL